MFLFVFFMHSPLIVMPSQEPQPKHITWCKTEKTYTYDYGESCSEEITSFLGSDKTPDSKYPKETWLDKENAKISLKDKKQQEYSEYLQSVFPDLTPDQIASLSLQELESEENTLIHQLDSMKQIDPSTGEICENDEYLALETELWILEDVLSCISNQRMQTTDVTLSASDATLPGGMNSVPVALLQETKQKNAAKGGKETSRRSDSWTGGVRSIFAFKCLNSNLAD